VRELRGGRYESVAAAGRGARLQSNVLAGFGCAVDTLFPSDK
jgi:hypothetical protein